MFIQITRETSVDQPYAKITFYVRHRINAVVVLLFTVTIMALALIPNIGYTADAQVKQRTIISGAHLTGSGYSVNRLFNGTINANFNPILYPISYLSGCANVLRKFSGASEVWDHEGTQLQEAAMLGTLFSEFAKNIPFFLALGIVSSILIERLSRTQKITQFFETHLPRLVNAGLPNHPENTTLPTDKIEPAQTKRNPIRRIIAIQLIISAYALGYIGIVHWNMFWPTLLLVILLIIIGAILY